MSSGLKAYMDIIPQLDKGGLASAKSQLENAFGTAVKATAAAMTAAMGAAFAGLGKIAKESFDQYANYEQLVGGVETLFKDSAGVVQKYAAKAFETAGLSANDYMETVTGFSASLIASLEGDTEKAAEVANVAITDMADNANKMGTSMESIQAAYQGFAKQNYTMLDNLKLGYGGTKTEMERLLKDAQKLSGVKYDISSYADIAEAIHVIQVNLDISGYSVDELSKKLANMSLTEEELGKVAKSMGITQEEALQRMRAGTLSVKDAQALLGTTAREAATTIQGSLGALKGAWSNFLVGLADSDADLKQLVDDVMDKLTIFVSDNMRPTLERIVDNIGRVLPSVVDHVIAIFQEDIVPLFTAIVKAITSRIPQIAQAGVTLLTSLIQELPAITRSICDSIPVITDAVIELLGSAEMLGEFVDAAIDIALAVVNAVPRILTALAPMIPSIVTDTTKAIIEHLPDFIAAAIDIVSGLVVAIPDIIVGLLDALPGIVEDLVTTFTDPENINKLIEAGKRLGEALVSGLIGKIAGSSSLIGATLGYDGNVIAGALGVNPNLIPGGSNTNYSSETISINTMNVTTTSSNLTAIAKQAKIMAGRQ